MESDGSLGAETRARVDKGCQIFLSENVEKILLMGWDYRDDSAICISDAMNSYLRDSYQIDASCVLIDRQSRDTVGDAVFSKIKFAHLAERKSCCIVTSDYHEHRVKIIFDFVYGNDWQVDVIGVPTSSAREKEESESASLDAFRRTFSGLSSGDVDGILAALVEKHPYYNGEIHPRVETAGLI